MAQMTEALARDMLNYCEQGQHPPLTINETEQLLRAWLTHTEPRYESDLAKAVKAARGGDAPIPFKGYA